MMGLGFTVDPVPAHAAAAFLSLLLLGSAAGKLRDLALFRAALDNYRLVPQVLLPVVAVALPVAEALAGLALLFVGTRAGGAWAALALLGLVTAAIVVNLRRGRAGIDCGCGGAGGQPLSAGLVVRNVVLCGLCLLSTQPLSARPTVWLDLLASLLAALFALGFYAVANQLLTHHPRLIALRNQP